MGVQEIAGSSDWRRSLASKFWCRRVVEAAAEQDLVDRGQRHFRHVVGKLVGLSQPDW